MTGEDPNVPSLTDHFSLVTGGPFYRTLRRIGLFDPHDEVRRGVVWLAVTWLPLLGLSIASGTAWGSKVKIPLLYDFSIYGRFLVALPLLIAAEAFIDPFARRVVLAFNSSGIITQTDLPAYHRAVEKIVRWRDSGWVELILLLLAGMPFFLLAADYEWVSNGVSAWHGSTSVGISLAGWWFTFVSSPLLRFLMLRWLWKYILWCVLLRRVSKLNLYLLPTHPDRAGGLGFLIFAQQQFGILAAALGAVLAGQFANEIAYFGEKIGALKAPMTAFIIISVFLILLPLTLFSLKLFEVRRDGLVRYSLVARGITSAFDIKYARKSGNPPESMMGTQDPSSLIDYISTYDAIRQTQVIPINKRAILYIATFAAAPFAPVWFFATPVDRVIAEILKRLI